MLILPAALISSPVAHLALFRWYGVTPRWARGRVELDRAAQPLWPDEIAGRDDCSDTGLSRQVETLPRSQTGAPTLA